MDTENMNWKMIMSGSSGFLLLVYWITNSFLSNMNEECNYYYLFHLFTIALLIGMSYIISTGNEDDISTKVASFMIVILFIFVLYYILSLFIS